MSPSLFRKRLRVLAGLPAAGGHPSGVVWERPYLCLIYLLDVGLLSFFFFFKWRSCSASFLLCFRGNCALCSGGLAVSAGAGEFRLIPHGHPETHLAQFYFKLECYLPFNSGLIFLYGFTSPINTSLGWKKINLFKLLALPRYLTRQHCHLVVQTYWGHHLWSGSWGLRGMPGKCMLIVMPESHQGHNTLAEQTHADFPLENPKLL